MRVVIGGAKEFRGRVEQGGQIVAQVYGTNRRRVQSELVHYSLMYEQDGPVVAYIHEKRGGRWVKSATG